MLMNFFLNLYDPNDYAQNQRRLWLAGSENQPQGWLEIWVKSAVSFTSGG
jgi:hypothetical protein